MIVTTTMIASPPTLDVYVSGLPADTTGVRLVRHWRGTATAVGGIMPVSGTEARIVDYGIPVGHDSGLPLTSDRAIFPGADTFPGADLYPGVTPETVTYSVQAVPSGASEQVSVPVPTVEHSQMWLTDPYAPMGGVLVDVLRDEDDGAQSGASDVELIHTMADLPIAAGRPRTTRARSWSIVSRDDQTTLAVDAALDGLGVLLLRGAPECLDHPSGVMWVTAPTVTRRRSMPHHPRVTWEWSGLETRGPSVLGVSTRTYADDLAEHPTYAASKAALPTYLDRMRG